MTLRTTVGIFKHITGLMQFFKELNITEETTKTLRTRCHLNDIAKDNKKETILKKGSWLIFQIFNLLCQPYFFNSRPIGS